jgi:hypothetical protein
VNIDLFKGVVHIGYRERDHTVIRNGWCSYACFSVACLVASMFNPLLDMPHLSGGWIILAKEKSSLTGIKQIYAQNLREDFCAY